MNAVSVVRGRGSEGGEVEEEEERGERGGEGRGGEEGRLSGTITHVHMQPTPSDTL